MKSVTPFLFYLSLLLLNACKEKNKQIEILPKAVAIEKAVINDAIITHGGNLYKKASYSFVFRNNTYSFNHKNNKYSVTQQNKKQSILDVFENNTLTHFINNKVVKLLPQESIKRISELNSVFYFTLIPYKLNDASVKKTNKGIISIKSEKYHSIKITFNEKGGGTDFQNIFYYWINLKTKTVDYMAYRFFVDNGGVRFRSAYNRRNVNGILFQDYINYKASKDTKLEELPKLYENNKLTEVSRIQIDNIIQLPN